MINFSGKVIVDKHLKSAKNADIPELVQKTKEIVEHPILGEIFDDVTFTRISPKSKNGFLIKFDGIDIPFSGNGKVTFGMVFSQLLVHICCKNNIPWYMNTEKGRIEFFKRLIDEHFRNKDV